MSPLVHFRSNLWNKRFTRVCNWNSHGTAIVSWYFSVWLKKSNLVFIYQNKNCQWSTMVKSPDLSHTELSVQFSCSVTSDSLQPHGLQHTRLSCPTPTPGAYSNSSIKSVMLSNHLILCRPLLLLPSVFSSIGVFSSESALPIRWPKLELQLQHQSFQWIFRTDFL